MLSILRKFHRLLTPRERRNAVILFCMILATGVLEALGVASVMPFLSVLSNPEVIQENALLQTAYNSLGFSSTKTFLFFLGVAVFSVVVFGLSLKALTQYFLARFTQMRNYSLSSSLLRTYLSRPYIWFLNRHSADLGKSILSEVQQVVNQALMPTAEIIAQSVIVLCLIVTLLLVDLMVCVVAALLLGGSYLGIYMVLRKYLSRMGTDRVHANKERFQIAQEALGGIKEVKAAGLEWGYWRSFQKPARRFSHHQAANAIIGQVPRFVLEAIAFGGMLLVILLLLAVRGDTLEHVLPTLGVFAFAGMRLLPAMQKVYQNATKLRFGSPALDVLYNDFFSPEDQASSTKPQAPDPKKDEARRTKTPKANQAQGANNIIFLNSQLTLENISFTYPDAAQPAIQDLTLTIRPRTTVAMAGTTGAGKTTLVDLIMGLLPPTKGKILVDGVPIIGDQSSAHNSSLSSHHSLRSWQQALGYVPQHIFLADDTIAANIAFGVPQDQIDMAAVRRAATIAELHKFVVSELPYGYETTVGERGVRLSGGQRQRIGIARALYHDPDVLILDEATSALDNLTEKAVMDAVHNLSRQKTIILIAHRLSTVQKCDQIFLLEHGRLHAQGTYTELLEISQEFRRMAAVNE